MWLTPLYAFGLQGSLAALHRRQRSLTNAHSTWALKAYGCQIKLMVFVVSQYQHNIHCTISRPVIEKLFLCQHGFAAVHAVHAGRQER